MPDDQDPNDKKRRKPSSFIIRLISTLIMLALLLLVIWGGHIPCAVAMLVFQAMIVQELFTFARRADEGKTMPLFRTQQWYFFAVACFYLYGRFARKNFAISAINLGSNPVENKIIAWLLHRHLMISYVMYIGGIVLFVLTLQQGQYSYQFRQLAWTHSIVFFTVVPSSFFVPLIFEGLLWFFLPLSLIIINDIMAYLAGKFLGRTPLIALSPKKTWEGFVGGGLGTVLAAVPFAWLLAQWHWIYCPRTTLDLGPLACEPPNFIQWHTYHPPDLWNVLPDWLVEEVRPPLQVFPAVVRDATSQLEWTCMPVQMHAIVLALFASIVGPFGGFFASGLKRAFGLKDFGASIPGHGGVTDRFDCQMLMAVFAYLYYHAYVASDQDQVEMLDVILDLGGPQRMRIFKSVAESLVLDGLLPADRLQSCLSVLEYQ